MKLCLRQLGVPTDFELMSTKEMLLAEFVHTIDNEYGQT